MAKATKKSAKKAAKPKAEKKAAKKEVKRTPRTPRLPGMEDAGIRELETIAEELNDVRTERIGLSKREGELQDDLLAVMRKHKKTEYHHEDVHAWVIPTDLKVKVKIGEVTPQKEKEMKEQTAKLAQLEEESAPKVDKRTEFNPPEPEEEDEDSESGEELEAIGEVAEG